MQIKGIYKIRGKIRVKRAKCEVVGKKKIYGIVMSI